MDSPQPMYHASNVGGPYPGQMNPNAHAPAPSQMLDQSGTQQVGRVSIPLIIVVALVSLVLAAGATFVAMRYIKTK